MSYARGNGAGLKRLAGPSKAALRPFVGSIGVSKAVNELRPGQRRWLQTPRRPLQSSLASRSIGVSKAANELYPAL